MTRRTPTINGFTIVELLIVIVVIGILAAIVIVAYQGIQSRAIQTTLQNDLRQASTQMKLATANNDIAPSTLPPSVRSSPKVTLSLVASTLPFYTGISPVQNGVLLSTICDNLISEGKGRSTNLAGGSEDYITGCGNWNHDSMQVTGWTTKVFQTPVSDSDLSNYADSVPAGSPYHLNQQSTVRGFYTELRERLMTQGGSFPLTTFWDYWAAPGNGGVAKQDLPAPDSSGANGNYCISASYAGNPVGPWHVRNVGSPKSGNC